MRNILFVGVVAVIIGFVNLPDWSQPMSEQLDAEGSALGTSKTQMSSFIGSESTTPSGDQSPKRAKPVDGIQHVKVYYEDGRFAGWPANHGMWSWGNEIAVGFVEARYSKEPMGLHTYDQKTARDKYARSLDGGLTWTIEDAYKQGQTAWRYNNQLGKEAKPSVVLKEAIDFTHPDFALTFLRTTNHIGPSHFYYSYDRGKSWKGAFQLPDLETPGIATRTDYIVNGPHDLLAFVTVGKSNNKEGRIACLQTTDGGRSWQRLSWLGPETDGFEIMSSSARLSPSKILTVVRKRTGAGQDLLASYLSEDNGQTWRQLENPVSDTGKGGSPPALIKMKDGSLALGYIYRSENGSRVCVKFSSNEGRTWSDEVVLRGNDGANRDVGYPRMLQRPDGKLIMAYYWNNVNQEGMQPYRYIAATIFDPKELR